MAFKAEALTLLIDVNPSVGDVIPGEDTFLQKSITAANMIIQRKMFNDTRATKSEASLILFGTNNTSNQLYDEECEGYEKITIAKEMGVMDLELLKFINRNIHVGSHNADFLDALVVALDHMRNRCLGRKMEQKVILFTNLNSEFGEDRLDLITKAFRDNNVNLVFVGPDIDEEDESNVHKKNLTPQQEIGIKCIRHILDEVDGEGVSANDVLKMVSFFECRRKNQVTTFRGPIEIGSNLKINSYAYVKCKKEPPTTWKKSSAIAEYGPNGQSLKVEMQRSYHRNDEDRDEVEKESIAQAYRYGKTLVPMTDDDKKSMKFETKKGCLVLGFTSQENIDRKLFSRDTCYMFTPQPDDGHAAVAFSALCHALEEKNMVAIVRFVFRANSDPKLGFLSPHIKNSYESLIFISLPFREDIRQYSFPSLKTENLKPEQKEVINGFIDSMMLVTDDEEDETVELLKPKDMLNPVIQRYYQCIQHRALNPDETRIPEIEDYILKSVQAVPEIIDSCKKSFDDIERCFPLKKVEEKEEKSVNLFNFNESASKDEPEEKRFKSDSLNKSDIFCLKSHVNEIDSADPIGSFSALVDGADSQQLKDLCVKMKDCVFKLVLDSFSDQYYGKAINCVTVVRKECEKLKISSGFNELLLAIKNETCGKQKNDFWERLKKESILPIGQDIANDSAFTKEDALTFFSDSNKKQTIEGNDPYNFLNDEDDDLLDLL